MTNQKNIRLKNSSLLVLFDFFLASGILIDSKH